MSLTSFPYILFLILCVTAYRLLPQRFRVPALLTASVGFYLFAMPAQLPVMLIYLWVIYILSISIARRGKKGTPLLYLGIGISVLYLFFYRYLDFGLSLLTGKSSVLSLAVPMGISYVTFQCISYLLSVSRKQIPALTRPDKFFLYALFFAKVTAGPIEPPDRFFAELKKKDIPLTWKSTLSLVMLILVGFAKKIAAADLIAPVVNSVFALDGAADGLSTAIAIALYSAQIYFDFSGYTDIALGSAALFGINLTENFDHPYAASSVVDFWKRWHISLTNWLRSYVYFPLGGSRVPTGRRYLNIMIVFLTSGLWHGANLTYVVWGLLHGICQVSEIALRKFLPPPEKPSALRRILSRARTLLLVALLWVFFRASSVGNAFRVLGGLLNGWAAPGKALASLGLGAAAWILFLITALGAGRMKDYALQKKFAPKTAVLICVVLTLLIVIARITGAASGAANSFIYFNF